MVTPREARELCTHLSRYPFRRMFTSLLLCGSLSTVCLLSRDSLAVPRAKPTAAPSLTPIGATAPIEVKMTDICCHFGMFTRREAKDPMIDHPKEEVVAQGEYFRVPVPASSAPGSNQAKCEEAKRELYDTFKRTATKAEPMEIDKLLSYDHLFKNERDKVPNLEAINTPLVSEDKVKVNDELWGTIHYARTTVYSVTAAFPERCEPLWCGVNGSLSGETKDSVPVPQNRSIIQRATAGYRYYSSLTERIDRSTLFDGTYDSKLTVFSFPVTKVDAAIQCSCETLATNYPPSHGSYVDEVLPWRDWIGPPDKLITDGKYSKDLCSAQ